MDKTDLKHLNAILKELYTTEGQLDIDDFCEYRLGIQEPKLYLKYTHWLIDQGYVRSENNPIQLVWITAKGSNKYEKGGLKLKDINPRAIPLLDTWQKRLGLVTAIITIVTVLYKFIIWLMEKFF